MSIRYDLDSCVLTVDTSSDGQLTLRMEDHDAATFDSAEDSTKFATLTKAEAMSVAYGIISNSGGNV